MWPLNVFFRFWRKRLRTPNIIIWLSMDWHAIHLSEEKTKMLLKLKNDHRSKFSNWLERRSKLENLLRWSFFTFIYKRSSNMNYFIYTSQKCYCLPFVFTSHLHFRYWSVEKRLGMSNASSFLPIIPRTNGTHTSNPFSAKIQINNDWIHAVRKNLLLGWRATAGMECILGSAIYLKSTGMSLKKQTTRWVMDELFSSKETGQKGNKTVSGGMGWVLRRIQG